MLMLLLRKWFLLFKKHISVCIFRLVFRCILAARKRNLTGFLIGMTGQSKNLDPTGAGRPNRFPSLPPVPKFNSYFFVCLHKKGLIEKT